MTGTINPKQQDEELLARAEKSYSAWAISLREGRNRSGPLPPYDADAEWLDLSLSEKRAWVDVVKHTDKARKAEIPATPPERNKHQTVWLFDNEDGTIKRHEAIALADDPNFRQRYVIGTTLYHPETARDGSVMFLDQEHLIAHAQAWSEHTRSYLRKLSAWLDDQGTGRK